MPDMLSIANIANWVSRKIRQPYIAHLPLRKLATEPDRVRGHRLVGKNQLTRTVGPILRLVDVRGPAVDLDGSLHYVGLPLKAGLRQPL